MTISVTRFYFTTQHKTCKTKTKTAFWSQTGLVLRPTVSDHIAGLEERCEHPSGVRGGALAAQRCFTIFSTQNGLSWQYNIVLLWITKKWNSIQSWVNYCAFGDTVWCFLVYETKFTVGKWQVVVFTAGKRRGRWGNSTLGESPWGNPPSSAGLKPHGPWRTGEIRGPWSYLKS